MGEKAIWQRTTKYAKSVGATKKVVGDLAYESPKYNRKTNKGRHVRLVSSKRGGDIIVHDNKRGNVSIGRTDD